LEDSEIEYGVPESDGALDTKIRGLCKEIGERAAAKSVGAGTAPDWARSPSDAAVASPVRVDTHFVIPLAFL
jgi:hypothetical protein